MKSYFWISSFVGMVVVLLFSAYLQPVYAHVLKTDGDIGAVVHIDPEDDPIVGQETTVYFDIKDKSGKFKIEDCSCIFIVKKNREEIYSRPLEGATGMYNFPEKNVYTLELHGTPKTAGQFNPFRLSYDVRVERVSEENNAPADNNNSVNIYIKHIPHLVIILLVVSVCGFLIYQEKRRNN